MDMKGGRGGWETAGHFRIGSRGYFRRAAASLPLDTGLVLGAPRCLGTVDSLILILGFLLARL